MLNLKSIIFVTFITIFLGACSSSKDTSNKNNNDEQEGYVFDEVPSSDSYQPDNTEDDLKYNFFVQIGAFTSKKSAEDFAEEGANNLNTEFEVKYNSISNLYTVRLKEFFNSRIKAEKIRNELWQDDKFKDAWIVKEHK
jgi:PBP1b-binding outer membrane lipoprotein LpoB